METISDNHPKIIFQPKGWGYEKWIDNREEYCGKILFFVKDKSCSAHYHRRKTETFYLRTGKLKVFYMDNIVTAKKLIEKYDSNAYAYFDSTLLKPGDNFHVPRGRVHKMLALEDSELIEFSTQHFEEDSFRLLKGD